MTPAIALRDLEVDRGSAPVVRGVSLTVPTGSWFGLIGANGSGKTSLLRAVAGRIAIRAGRCEIDGRDLSGDRQARAERIGFMPPQEMLPARLSLNDLLRVLTGDADRALAAVGPLAAALELGSLRRLPIGRCSAGMRQRIALALAFAEERPVVILDEPFNWLDPVAAFDLREALSQIVAGGRTLVTALHDLTTLVGACDSAALLRGGEVARQFGEGDLGEARGDPARFERRMIALLREGDAN